MGQLKGVTTRTLEVGYLEQGPSDGPAVLLLHGFPYDVHSYEAVTPLLAARGHRVVVPYLRGHGPTRFLSDATVRSGQQAALGADVLELLDALDLPEAVLAGYDWGGRAACVAAALHPDRVSGLVTVNGYLIQDVAAAARPLPPQLEAGFWYFFYFLTERGRAGLAADPRGVAEVIWRRNSPAWHFDAATLDRTAAAFANPDYVDVVLHSYRHRLGQAPGDPAYDDLERALAERPVISVPTVTLEGEADGNFPVTEGLPDADRFTGPRLHRRVPRAGHNLPQEAPEAFVRAVTDVIELNPQTDPTNAR
ncbi:alpha/beta hydrolase [Nocardioides sp. CER19]|uniref:alpha/beta fold hydrolase n=1 Tax=Nocardioides sp. CER19 TaxID=3038538 RepID=UPI00244B1CB6|nr:alpha/beta hydrolase [Nocardioides sp. CER19]MDH2414423.1 alpha/beta hydrolase [Nocardioides sp. CER19]